ncbi:MAG: hypothetical protein GY751_07790, partial [Bacteroidetes bacterium]|nr:hypothetical protein [Bacteroidota bacterium]
MIETSIKVVTLLSAFFWGSFHCKNHIDKSPYAECTHERVVEEIDGLITRFMLLNKKIAISQFFQFQMLYCYTDVGVPYLGGVDTINLKKAKIQKKYMLRNIREYFDIDKYYALMKSSLEFDPDNFYTRQFGTYSALNWPMVM